MHATTPLAERMRPKNLDEYIGQQHLVGPGAVLRRMIESGNLASFILWGPPGVGKTSLAKLIANQLDRPFYTLSAINAGVKDIREVIEKARQNTFFSAPRPVLFIDEIHRFSKAQQDSLLGAVEQGVITLVGATTENPSFEVISALLSRCQVYTLKALQAEELSQLLHRALETDALLSQIQIEIAEYDALLRYSGGDARKLLNLLELVVAADSHLPSLRIDNQLVVDRLQQNLALYDKSGEQHYDIISAFIKSVRGSDPDAALYWLARMLEGGEDVLFIARRLIILAAEDIGLANPNALLLANNCFQAVHQIGMPEARIILGQTTVYLAASAKSNSAYLAIDAAIDLVRKTGNQPVPLHLRNAPTQLMKQLNYGKDYKYAHDYPGNFVAQDFLPEDLLHQRLYSPQNNPAEHKLREWLGAHWGNRFD